MPIKLFISFGTRPELIKLAPVIRHALHTTRFECHVHCTGQHQTLLDGPLTWFDVTPDSWAQPESNTALSNALGCMIQDAHLQLVAQQPDVILVHGDTTSALATSLAGFYLNIPVVHLEAGLRTGDRQHPWPEEIHRRLITTLSVHHLAPTLGAKKHLLAEGVPDDMIAIVGNTVIDALLWTTGRLDGMTPEQIGQLYKWPDSIQQAMNDNTLVLVTVHRRENFPQTDVPNIIVTALRRLAVLHPDKTWVLPVHPNPHVSKVVQDGLSGLDNMHLMEPLDYPAFVHLFHHAELIVTDSGGIQEEATALAVPVVVLRQTTERIALLDSGQGVITGLNVEDIIEQVRVQLTTSASFGASAPYGHGQSSIQCLDALWHWFGLDD